MVRSVNRCESSTPPQCWSHAGAARLKWVSAGSTPSVQEHPKQPNWLGLSPGCSEPTCLVQLKSMCQRSGVFSRRVFLEVCVGAPSCCRIHECILFCDDVESNAVFKAPVLELNGSITRFEAVIYCWPLTRANELPGFALGAMTKQIFLRRPSSIKWSWS